MPARAGWHAWTGRVGRHAGPLTAVGLALLVLGPLLAPGYVLTYDMLFTPWPRLHAGLLGLSGDVPRNVPTDLLVALAGQVVPAWVVQKAVLLAALAGAGWGAARLAPTSNPAGKAAAAALYTWNAFVYERLVIGHWALLIGYAAMPWVAAAAAAWRAGRAGGAPRLAAALAVAACGSPHGSVMAAGLAAAVLFTPTPRGGPARRWLPALGGEDARQMSRGQASCPQAQRSPASENSAHDHAGRAHAGRAHAGRAHAGRAHAAHDHAAHDHAGRARGDEDPGRAGAVGWRRGLVRAGLLTGMVVVLNAPWLVPSLLHPGGIPVRAAGAAAFAARPDTPLGTLGSLLTLGGIWNANAVPPGRGSLLWLPGFVALVGLAVAGWRLVPARLGRGSAAGLLLAAALGLLVAGAWAVPWLRPAVLLVVEHVPGGGLFRDAQKHVAALALVEAVGLAAGVERLLARIGSQTARRAAAGALVVLAPILLLPSLAWGLGGRLAAVPYPASWGAARAAMAADPVTGATLVLPWHLYLALPWNGGRVTINPALHAFPRRVVLNDDLELPGMTVAGEDPFAARVAPLVRGGGPLGPDLAAAGVRHVLVLRGGGGGAGGQGPPDAPAGPGTPAGTRNRGLTAQESAALALDRQAIDAEGRLGGAERVLDLPDLALYRLDEPAPAATVAVPALPVIVADLGTATLLCWLAVRLAVWRIRRRRTAQLPTGRAPPARVTAR